MMNTVKKFTTFDELKFCESKASTSASGLKKPHAFEKVIMKIRSDKMLQARQTKPKP